MSNQNQGTSIIVRVISSETETPLNALINEVCQKLYVDCMIKKYDTGIFYNFVKHWLKVHRVIEKTREEWKINVIKTIRFSNTPIDFTSVTDTYHNVIVDDIQILFSDFMAAIRTIFPHSIQKPTKQYTDEQLENFFLNELSDVFSQKYKEHQKELERRHTPYEPNYQLNAIAGSMSLSHKKPKTTVQLSLPLDVPVMGDPGFLDFITDSFTSQEELRRRLATVMGECESEASLYIRGNLLMGQSIGIDCYLWLKRAIVNVKFDANGRPPSIVGDFTSYTQLSEIITGFSQYSNEVKSVFTFLSKANFNFQDSHKESRQSLVWVDYNSNNTGFKLYVSNRLLPGHKMPNKDSTILSHGERTLKLHVPLPDNIPVYSNRGASLQKIAAILFNSWLTSNHSGYIYENGYFNLDIKSFYQFLSNKGFEMDKRTLQKIIDKWIETGYLLRHKDGYKLGESETKSWNYLIGTGELIIKGKKRQARQPQKK